MKISESDLKMFAARIRLHFEPELRDTAYDLALGIARVVGARVKDLRPETTLTEIQAWYDTEASADSLDTVELAMALEEEFGIDGPSGRPDTFRDLVLKRAGKRAT